MEDQFTELQRELHLPEPGNEDPYSPENTIISYNVPSIYRYAWHLTHVVDLAGEKNKFYIKKIFHKLLDLKINCDWDKIDKICLSLRNKPVQTFYQDQIQYYLKQGVNLPWFFTDGRYCVDMLLYDDKDLCLSFETRDTKPIQCAGVYQSVTGSQSHHKIRDGNFPLVLAYDWIDTVPEANSSDHVVSIMVISTKPEGNLTIRALVGEGDELIPAKLVSCQKVFLADPAPFYVWKNYREDQKVKPGLPSHAKYEISGEYDRVYYQVCREIELYVN